MNFIEGDEDFREMTGMTALYRYASVFHCSACEQDHSGIQFFYLVEPKTIDGVTYQWAGKCPVADELIYATNPVNKVASLHHAKLHDLCKYCGKSEDAHLPDCPGDAEAMLKRVKWLETEVRVLIAMNESGK